jgi:hypothetical protein
MAFFMTVDDANAGDLEEGIRRHNDWHRQQGDTWTWDVWQSVTGAPEYAYISSGHNWADFDAMDVDAGEDHNNWARTGAQHSDVVNTVMWQDLAWGSRPPTDTPALVQVFEFVMNPGGQEAFNHVVRKFTEAAESTAWPGQYTWSQNLSGPGGTTHFVVIPAANFAAFNPQGSEPLEVLTEAYGAAEARQLMEMFESVMTPGASRIWAHRPDLSYQPN